MKNLRVFIWILRGLIISISFLPVLLLIIFRNNQLRLQKLIVEKEIREAVLNTKIIKSEKGGISTFYYYDAIVLVNKEGKFIKYLWNTGKYLELRFEPLSYIQSEKIDLLLKKNIVVESYGRDTLIVFFLNPEVSSISEIQNLERLYKFFLFFSFFWISLGFVVSFIVSYPYGRLIEDVKRGKIESLSFLRDILSREYMEALEKEREKKEKFLHMAQMILKNVPRGVAIMDEKGNLLLRNEIFDELKNFEKIKSILDKVPLDFFLQEVEERGRYFVVKIMPFSEEKLVYVEIEDITEERKRKQMQEREEKFLLISETVSTFLHEIRNSLSSLKAFLSIVDLSSPDLKTLFEPVKEEINNISESLLLYDEVIKSKGIKSFKRMNLKEIVEVVVKEFTGKFKGKRYEVINRVGDVEAEISPFLLRRALFNLLKNSYEALEDEGYIEISSAVVDNIISLIVEDTGCGMKEEEIEKAILPFYTTKEKGLGLGLPFAKKVMELHGGDIELVRRMPKGMKVVLRFKKER